MREVYYAAIEAERYRQDQMYGLQMLPNSTLPLDPRYVRLFKGEVESARRNGTLSFGHILLEETYEAIVPQTHPDRSVELIQVAAVAVSWAEALQSGRAW